MIFVSIKNKHDDDDDESKNIASVIKILSTKTNPVLNSLVVSRRR